MLCLTKTSVLAAISLLFFSFCHAQPTEKMTIHFDFNRSEITPETARQLDSMLQNKKAPITWMKLEGHCDQIGSHAYNDSLSLQRVVAVKNYLLGKGITTAQITELVGLGKRKLLTKNSDEGSRAMNRRVELEILRTPVDNSIEKKEEPKNESLTKLVTDTAVKKGSKIVLKNLNFQGGRHFLLDESMPVLEELLQIMKDNPTLVIEIQGHVCCTTEPDGIDLDNDIPNLSVQRARTVYEYLVDHGIPASRLSYRGFGSTQKIYPFEKDEFERTQNRRVEIKIISK
jgi:outer membrane protein OmpA-like peptidoglycan-associated protein